jgi:type IV secretion system protein VirD4
MLGQATEKKMQRTYSGSGLWLTNRSESEQEYARPLLTASEVTQLPPDDGLLLVGGLQPYRGKKVRYYLDARFRERGSVPAPDSAAEQGGELLRSPAHDWAGLHVVPRVALGAAAASAARAEPAPHAAAAAPPANPTATNLPTAPRDADAASSPVVEPRPSASYDASDPAPNPTADEDLLYDPNS